MAGTYEKIALLGSGSYGKAWLVFSHKRNNKSVLKEIRLDVLGEKEMDQALVEVKVLARCRHVNIVSYFDAFVTNGCLLIEMEYADGGDMQKKILDQKGIHFDTEVILDWFIQICFALRYLHAQNILHRDLKPQNLFLTADGIIKLGDFGIARILQDSSDHAFTAIGTPYYLSPEVCQRQPYNFKSDMWSVGCVLYELCSLHVPFQAQNLPLLVLKILDGSYDPIPSHNGAILEDLVTVLLNTDPNHRPSAVQVLNVPALQSYVKTTYRKCIRRRVVQQKLKDMSKQPDALSPCAPDAAAALQKQKTYTVKSALLRRLSVATPKSSHVSQQQKSVLSPNTALAHKRLRKASAPILKLENAVLHSPGVSKRHNSEFEDKTENRNVLCTADQDNEDVFFTVPGDSLNQAQLQNYKEEILTTCRTKEYKLKSLKNAQVLERQMVKKTVCNVESFGEGRNSSQSSSQVTNPVVCPLQMAAEADAQYPVREKEITDKPTRSATYTVPLQPAGTVKTECDRKCSCESLNCMLRVLYQAAVEGQHDKTAAEQVLLRYLLDHLGVGDCEKVLKNILKAIRRGVVYSSFEESAEKNSMGYLPVILQLAMLLDKE